MNSEYRHYQPQPEDPERPTTEPENSQPAAERAREILQAMDSRVRHLIQSGIDRLQQTNTHDLSQNQVALARRETGIVQKITSIHERMRNLLNRSRSGIAAQGYFADRNDFTFDPTDINTIGADESLPSSQEKKELVNGYKENLAYQKEGLARMQAGFMATIRQNPEVSHSELVVQLRDYAKQYSLNEQQVSATEEVLEKYGRRHRAINRFRNAHQTPSEAFRALTGVQPKGDVWIVYTPAAICAMTSDPMDYVAAIRAQGIPRDEAVRQANLTNGHAFVQSRIPGLEGAITLTAPQVLRSSEQTNATIAHEEEHAVRRLFDLTREPMDMSIDAISEAKDDNVRSQLMLRFLRQRRKGSDRKAQEEILAFFRQGMNEKGVAEMLDGYEADFLTRLRREDSELLVEKLGQTEKSQIDAAIDRVYRQEYREEVRNGIEAFATVRNRLGYTLDETIAFFSFEPLDRWSKITQRQINAKTVNST